MVGKKHLGFSTLVGGLQRPRPPRGIAAETRFPQDSAADSRGYAWRSLAIPADLWRITLFGAWCYTGFTGYTAPYKSIVYVYLQTPNIYIQSPSVTRVGGHCSGTSCFQDFQAAQKP